MSSQSFCKSQEDDISNNDASAKSISDKSSYGKIRNSISENKSERKVMVLYTGGTIGMVRNKDGVLTPVIDEFVTTLRKFPQLHDSEYALKKYGSDGPLVLPKNADDDRRIIYEILKYSNICDSCDMTMNDWINIALHIKKCYEQYDGFVVLHGTDTLSYTASALSFIIEGLDKPIILTGSQVPIFDARSDGFDNFLASLIIAAYYNIPEVCVFFSTNLLRGNRTSKVSACKFDAFHSPNYLPLATANIKIEVNHCSIFYPSTLHKFGVHATLNRNVGLLRMFPSITSTLVKAFLQPPIEGVVLQSYGVGNMPTNREDIIKELSEATSRGVIIVNVTQCSTGSVTDIYKAGRLLREAGVTMGFDMTPEAALTKLAYILSKSEWDTETKRQMMQTNLRGELTLDQSSDIKDLDSLDAITKSMELSSTGEFQNCTI